MRFYLALLAAAAALAAGRIADPPSYRQLLRKLASSPDMQQYMRDDPRSAGQLDVALDNDMDKTTLELIRENGYVAEQHDVTTADGYILSLHRIPYGRDGPGEGPRTPVHLQHGLLSASSDWIMQPPERALAYMLADRGYDVWLGNARGNTYSRSHVNITADDPEFWKFTWDQMGQYDSPAMIDYILETTGQQQIFWVGHSMGTTMFWVMMNDHPEYNDKVALMQGLGPVARVDHMHSVIRIFAPYANEVEALAELMGLNEFLPSDELMTLLAEMVCEPWEATSEICDEILFLLCGYDPEQLNQTALPIILAHTPAGASTRSVIHYAQEINAEKFLHFDWGKEENIARYGQATPPEYDLSFVTCPVSLFWSDNDLLADPEDVAWLAEGLPNIIEKYRVPLAAFNHLDYLWAIDGDILVYNHVIENIQKFENAQKH
ncbi:lipase 3-like isoform X2 [Amphibalanus amphitrite]|uniref:lipase 3-like isoform X2 n=1 Tax=Amphibalanus amphitrite TaxID=1232801 RepID=UPI001C90148D|nr:lipase 3-like isoform X2 [Amphibalanus amphitrite]XP_043240496.1 lipase 3-like isoform X2 [Amphibalanus amphitrite]XP_043240497.1 lipase 3-like isoform X2 [Amphibalanus amphitrite]